MLWTLHNRSSGARGPRAILDDPDALRIIDSIEYDFERSFGKAELSHAIRSKLFDGEVNNFLATAPRGTIVNLGEGLETQRFRVLGDHALWISVDLPEAMSFREQFITPDATHLHLPQSATDLSWCDAVRQDEPVFVTAQGLFMYLEPAQLGEMLSGIARRLPQTAVMFDHIPHWLSRKTLRGMQLTPTYTTPKMPWGVNINELPELLQSWIPSARNITPITFDFADRGIGAALLRLLQSVPVLKNKLPGITRFDLS